MTRLRHARACESCRSSRQVPTGLFQRPELPPHCSNLGIAPSALPEPPPQRNVESAHVSNVAPLQIRVFGPEERPRNGGLEAGVGQSEAHADLAGKKRCVSTVNGTARPLAGIDFVARTNATVSALVCQCDYSFLIASRYRTAPVGVPIIGGGTAFFGERV